MAYTARACRLLPEVAPSVAMLPPLHLWPLLSPPRRVSDNILRKTADALVSSGLAALGFTYVNVDDCCEKKEWER